jgi:O-antigen ligase
MIFLAIIVLATIKENSIFQIKDRLVRQPLFLFFISFYLLHIIGLFWTSNLSDGFHYLQTSITLLLFPILFALVRLNFQSMRFISSGLIAGVFTISIFYLVRAYLLYQKTHDIEEFNYTRLSIYNHPTYLTMEINLAVLFLMYDLTTFRNKLFSITGILSIALIVYFCWISVLLESRTAMFSLAFTICFFLLYAMFKHDRFKLIGKVMIIACLLLSIPTFNFIKTTARYRQMEVALNDYQTLDLASIKGDKLNSSSERLAFWTGGMNIFRNNLLIGVGTGDLKDTCIDEFKRLNFEYGVKEFNNMHSQYLQTGIMLGTIGLCFFLLILFYPLILALKQGRILYVSFILIIAINAVTASLLTASGVIFYAFFNSLFCRVKFYEIDSSNPDSAQISS